MIVEELYLQCWRLGVKLEVEGNEIVARPASHIPDDLKARLIESKNQLLRFLAPHAWVMTPHGPAKYVMTLKGGRCGVVLKSKPDCVPWLQKTDISLDCVSECVCDQTGCPV